MAQDVASNLSVGADSRQPCRVCCEPVLVGANKCTHCDSYQDWTRYLLRWSSVGVAVLALLPLWGIFQSLHQIAFAEKAPRIQAALTTCQHDVITAAYINSGTVDGIVTDFSVTLEYDGKVSEPDFAVRAKPDGDIVISPNQPATLINYRAYIGGKETLFLKPNHGRSNCFFRLNVIWSDFTEQTRTLEPNCTCPA